jgi:hypothetical protein
MKRRRYMAPQVLTEEMETNDGIMAASGVMDPNSISFDSGLIDPTSALSKEHKGDEGLWDDDEE